MGLINDSQLMQVPAQKALAPVTPVNPAQPEDWFTRLDRIVSNVNSLLDLALKIKGNQGGNSQQDTMQRRFDDRINDAPAQRSVVRNEKADEVKDKIVAVLIEHLDKCSKENPNMPLGEAILKFPMNVTQAKGLLALVKMMK